MALLEIGLVVLGVALGAAIGWLLASNRFSGEIGHLKARSETEESMEARIKEREEAMTAQMEVIANRVTQSNSENFLTLAEERLSKVTLEAEKDHDARKKEMEGLIKPMTESLANLDEMSKKMEKERIDAYAGMKRHMQILEQNTEQLGKEANSLSTALRKSSSVRGDWGEVALRNLLEMAGMTKNTDFLEQKGIDGGGRPDFVVRLPGDGAIPIDAKTTAKHYLESLEEQDPGARAAKVAQHAKAMRGRVTELTRKDYLSGVSGRAEFVVMFVPSEALISSAFEVDPELHAHAMERGVIIAGPASMIALLKLLHYTGNKFVSLRKLPKLCLSPRNSIFVWQLGVITLLKVGKRLDKATEFYNKAVGSWERNVIPQGKKLEELEVARNLPKELKDPEIITEEIRMPRDLSDGIDEEE